MNTAWHNLNKGAAVLVQSRTDEHVIMAHCLSVCFCRTEQAIQTAEAIAPRSQKGWGLEQG